MTVRKPAAACRALPDAGNVRVEVDMYGLGELESAVMDVLWRCARPVKVRDVLEQLSPTRPLAYTTVMTVLDNLHRKSWVARELHGKAYHYTPVLSREQVAARALREVLDSCPDPRAVLLHFAASVSAQESELLRDALPKTPRR